MELNYKRNAYNKRSAFNKNSAYNKGKCSSLNVISIKRSFKNLLGHFIDTAPFTTGRSLTVQAISFALRNLITSSYKIQLFIIIYYGSPCSIHFTFSYSCACVERPPLSAEIGFLCPLILHHPQRKKSKVLYEEEWRQHNSKPLSNLRVDR